MVEKETSFSIALLQVFVEEQVNYAGQAIGLVVAKDRETAVRAAKLVTVEYEEIEKPTLTIDEAVKQGREELAVNFMTGKREAQTLGDIEGEIYSGQLLVFEKYSFFLIITFSFFSFLFFLHSLPFILSTTDIIFNMAIHMTNCKRVYTEIM